MTYSLVQRELLLADDVAANDVSVLSHSGELYLAWGAATLQREAVWVGRFKDTGLEHLQVVENAFRPSLHAGPSGPFLTCQRASLERVAIPLAAPADTEDLPPASLALKQTEAHLAIGGETWIARVDDDGTLSVGRVADEGVSDVQEVVAGGAEDPPGAPVFAAVDGKWWLAWHEPLDDGTLRWLRVASAAGDCSPAPPDACRSADGVDQGWEFPAMAFDEAGRLWLAGRSSNGFHLQVLASGQWTGRIDLSGEGWSNRSRTCGLAPYRGDVVFARGTPKGLVVTRLELDTRGGRTTSRAAPPPRDAYAALAKIFASTPRPTTPTPEGWPRVLFGDIHQHSVCSDGTGEPERAYLRARGCYGHEIFALTDHEKLGRRCLGPVTWRHQCQLADHFYEPGEFVTLKAYEFTGARLPGPGHKCVYFDESVPEALPEKTVEALLPVLREHGAIAVPHHVAWTGADLEHHDEDLQPVWEICSVHGAYEVEDEQRIPPRGDVLLEGQYIRQALDAGLMFGFVGGTDAHGLRWHHGVSRRADPLRTGLTAVFAEPTRESVLAALRRRRCYATSGARILLRVDLDGAPMGSVVRHHAGQLHVEAEGTAPIERLSVIQDGSEVHVEQPASGASASLALRLEARGARSYCYVRVQQADGEDAWSSPIWLLP
jgi:hypothetical protein